MNEIQPYTIPENLFEISPVEHDRPYLSTPKEQERYMQFIGYERGTLTARISELNSRAEQIMYIYLCRKSKAYLAVADRTITTSRHDDQFFYDWLDELAVQGVAIAAKSKYTSEGYKYQWDKIQQDIDICLDKGLDLETAVKVSVVGHEAIKKYLKYGKISLLDNQEDSAPDAIPVHPVDRATQAELLKELAVATSSRDATLTARDNVTTDFYKVSSIDPGSEVQADGYRGFHAEVQRVNRSTGEATPYKVVVLIEEDAPHAIAKFLLGRWSESLSRII